jgi:hypothetical protein
MAIFDPYNTNQSGYQSAVEEFKRVRGGQATYDQWAGNVNRDLQSYGARFSSLFENLVGRAPTEEEAGKLYTQLVNPNMKEAGLGGDFDKRFQDYATEFIGSNYRQAAEDTVNQKLQAQQGEASRLADLFRTQGNTAINGVEEGLMSYQQKLFERLRPQLITSLQAQGLLNTGGLNQAIAGQQADLANEAANKVADLRYQNDQQANAIAFGGQQAPYLFEQQNAMNALPQMQASSQNALGMNFQNFTANNNFARQMELLNRQAQIQREQQPSFLRTLGQSTATSLGQNLGRWVSPSTASNAATAGTTGGM